MKKIYIIVQILCLVVFSGCEDFLEESPKDFYETKNFYVDEASLHTGLLGVYERLSFSFFDVNMAFMGTLGTDESLPLYYGADVATMYKYVGGTDFIVYENFYRLMYEGISRAHFIMEEAPEVPGVSAEYVQQVINESKALRAFFYFQLAQNFGPVALLDKSMKQIDYTLPRSPLKDVYALILDDLNEALASGSLLAEKSAAEPGRLTQDAVRGILGKVYLTLASSKEAGVVDGLMNKIGKNGFGFDGIDTSVTELYALAASTLEPLVHKYQLNPEYGEVFCNDNKNVIDENMWELQYIDNEPGGSSWKKRMGVLWFPPSSAENMVSNASGWSQINYTPYLWNNYAIEDKRKAWNTADFIFFKGNEANPSYFNPNDGVFNEAFYSWCGIIKFRIDADAGLVETYDYVNHWNLPINTTVLRFADILLAYAEAEIGANNGVANNEAVDAVNRVRNRARGVDVDPNSTVSFPNYTTSNLTAEAILKERLLELCFENVRWYDLTRTGTLVENYNAPTIVGNYKQGLIDEDNYLRPIPQSQIDRSENSEGFFQNPGY